MIGARSSWGGCATSTSGTAPWFSSLTPEPATYQPRSGSRTSEPSTSVAPPVEITAPKVGVPTRLPRLRVLNAHEKISALE